MSFQTYSSRYNFFVKWRNVQLCMQINFITNFFIYCPWFSRNNSISSATSLKTLRKESLWQENKRMHRTLDYYESLIAFYISFLSVFSSLLQQLNYIPFCSPRFYPHLQKMSWKSSSNFCRRKIFWISKHCSLHKTKAYSSSCQLKLKPKI